MSSLETTRKDWPKLAPAPREVPLSYGIGAVCGAPLMQAGLLLLVFALFPMWGVLPYTDAASLWRYDGELELSTARIVHMERMSATEGGGKGRRGTPIQRIDFEFEHEGKMLAGTSYGAVKPPEAGSTVEVEFPRAQPQFARIRGLRSDLFGPAALMSLLLPLTGMVLAVIGLVQALRALALASRGRSALGRTQELKFLRTRKRREYHRATYSFSADGAEIRGSRDTTNKSIYEDAGGLRVLFDPQAPQRHQIVDELPVPPRFDALGRLQPLPTRKLALALILPTLAFAGYASWAVWMLLR